MRFRATCVSKITFVWVASAWERVGELTANRNRWADSGRHPAWPIRMRLALLMHRGRESLLLEYPAVNQLEYILRICILIFLDCYKDTDIFVLFLQEK